MLHLPIKIITTLHDTYAGCTSRSPSSPSAQRMNSIMETKPELLHTVRKKCEQQESPSGKSTSKKPSPLP